MHGILVQSCDSENDLEAVLSVRFEVGVSLLLVIILILINIYIVQIPCEYVQMHVTNKYYTY